MTTAKVSEKGQVTIPKALRDSLGIDAGDVLEFEEHRGRLVARKRVSSEGMDEVFGILSHLGLTTDEMMLELRGDPPVLSPDEEAR
ncbi:MAG: AbrB/MazE/SpoVT family DNA-binding domain-containing protein [Actinomycetota bacterium]